jgi:hypothetical protein
MDPALIALLALLASALQVAILRAIDYYFPRGHTAVDDRIAESEADRKDRRHREDKRRKDEMQDREDEDS